VGHPVEPVADVRRTDARSRKRHRPEGVRHGFHVIVYKVDPSVCVFARNLLSKNRWRAALFDEVVPRRPEVPLVIKRKSFACRAERLARAGTGPNRSIVGPAGTPQRVRPDADAGKEMALGVGLEIAGVYILYVSFIYVAWRDVAGGYQVAQPCGGVCVDFVVVGRHTPIVRRAVNATITTPLASVEQRRSSFACPYVGHRGARPL
jgi:hypothetical protein